MSTSVFFVRREHQLNFTFWHFACGVPFRHPVPFTDAMEIRRAWSLLLVVGASLFLVFQGPPAVPAAQLAIPWLSGSSPPCGDDVTCNETNSKSWHATSEARSKLMATHLVHQISLVFGNKDYMKKTLSILDYGCSTGFTTFSIQKVFPNSSLTGFDVDAESIRTARQRAQERSTLVHFVTSLPLDLMADGLTCLNVFTAGGSVQDLAQKIQGLLLHVKDGGFLWIVFKTSSDDKILRDFSAKLPRVDVNFLGLDSVKQALDQQNLDAEPAANKKTPRPVAPKHYFLLRNSQAARIAVQRLSTSSALDLRSGSSMATSAHQGALSLASVVGHAHHKKFPTLSAKEEKAFHARLDPKWSYVMELPICKRAAQVCTSRNILRLKFALLAEAKMYKNMLGIGGYNLACYTVLCFVLGVVAQLGLLCCTRREDWETHHGKNGKDEVGNEVTTTLAKLRHRLSGFFRPLEYLHTIWRPLDYCLSWWWVPPEFTQPMVSMKLFVAMLLVVELSVWMSPEQCVLATPELIDLAKTYPWKIKWEEDHNLVPPMAFWLMPGLNGATADYWVSCLKRLRLHLLLSWGGFMLLPSKLTSFKVAGRPGLRFLLPLGNGLLYGYGAFIYAYFGTIGLMYNLAHSVQGGMLFVLAAAFAVPFLDSNPRANAWLRKFLIINVLVPVYLFAGLCKLRYMGIATNMSGGWLVSVLQDKHRAIFPALNEWATRAPAILGFTKPWPCMLMSWGNLLVEFILPLLCMMTTNQGIMSSFIRLLFFFSAISFHLGVFLTMGPNFMRQVVLIILACNPLYIFRCESGTSSERFVTLPTYGDRLRGALGFAILVAWYATQMWSDLDHLAGRLPLAQHHNPYFPLPELSMFADHRLANDAVVKSSNYKMSCLSLIIMFLALIGKMWRDVQLHSRHSKAV